MKMDSPFDQQLMPGDQRQPETCSSPAEAGRLSDHHALMDDQEYSLWLAWSGQRHATGLLRPYTDRH